MKRLFTQSWLVSLWLLSVNADAQELSNQKVKQLIPKSVVAIEGQPSTAKLAQLRDFTERKTALSKPVKSRYLIEFHEPTVASQAHLKPLQAGLRSSAYQLQQNSLKLQQSSTIKTLQAAFNSMKVISQHTVLINAVQVDVSDSQLKFLKQRPEVKRVYPVMMRYLNLDASHQLTNVTKAWQEIGGQLEAGKDIKIAIIDTGIRPENPLFNDAGFEPVDMSTNTHVAENPDYCRRDNGDASFCNNKLILARYADPQAHEMDVYSGEYLSPKDFNGHGSHVAGIAAGNPVNLVFNHANLDISGAAPGARLMVYKAMYTTPSGQAMGLDTMLLEALESAVLDGADVINNSWGAGTLDMPQNSIYNQVFSSAEDMGIVVVSAAGNSLHPGANINCPACIESGIAVANTTHGRFFGNAASVNGKAFFTYQGQNQQLEQDLSLVLKWHTSADGFESSGCKEITSDYFKEAIVLLGFQHLCTLEQVADNFKAAGAKAVMLFQDGAFGVGTYEPLLPNKSVFSIPVFGLSRSTAMTLVEEAYSGKHLLTIAQQVTQSVESQYADMVNPFSSTGPNNDPNILKPDIAAPGTNILSAYSPDEFVFSPFPGGPLPLPGSDDKPVFAMISGTSMATPQVAGAAAILKQQHPDWTAKQIKSALMTTSESQVRLGVDPANPFEKGAGRLDAHAALSPELVFERPSWASGACIGICSFSNVLANQTDKALSWNLSGSFSNADTWISISPETISLSPQGEAGDSADIRITIDASRADPNHRLYKQWVFGELVAESSTGGKQHIPLAVYANDSSDQGSLLVSYDGNQLQSQQDVVFRTRVRNISRGESAQVQLSAPDNAEFVANSENITLSNASSDMTTMSVDNSEYDWSGVLQAGSMDIVDTDSWENFSLAAAGVQTIPCNNGCSGFLATLDFNYRFNGQNYNTLTITDNGFVVAGEASFGYFTALFNQRFPQPGSLNNIIAPFWTEFDLLDPDLPGDTGSGSLRAAIRVIDEVNYLVVEWDDVGFIPVDSEDDNAGAEDLQGFTFQLIIEENTDNILFNYLNIPFQPDFLSIGAENTDGSIGINYHFDGEGINLIGLTPDSRRTLQLRSKPEGTALIEVAMSVKDGQDWGVIDAITTQEEQAVVIDVLANDVTTSYILLSTQATIDQSHKAIAAAPITATGGLNAASLEIVSQPQKGSVTVMDNKLMYSPDENAYGEDQFDYRVADGAGIFSRATAVRVNIEPINDKPVLNPLTNLLVIEGQQVMVRTEAEDVDGDSLTLKVTQTTGELVETMVSELGFQFVAPDVQQQTLLTFEISASDGTLESTKQVFTVTVVEAQKSGGALNILVVLLLSVFAFCMRLTISDPVVTKAK